MQLTVQTNPLQKSFVVRYHKQRAGILDQHLLERNPAGQIQMVVWLIQQQQLWWLSSVELSGQGYFQTLAHNKVDLPLPLAPITAIRASPVSVRLIGVESP